MGAQFWYKIFKTTNKKIVQKEWKKTVESINEKCILDYIKAMIKESQVPLPRQAYDTKKNKRPSPSISATLFFQYQNFHQSHLYDEPTAGLHINTYHIGNDKKYYEVTETKNGIRRWKKVNTKDFNRYWDVLTYCGSPYSFASVESSPTISASYVYVELKKPLKQREVIEFIKNNHRKWEPALAIEVGRNTIIGGLVAT